MAYTPQIQPKAYNANTKYQINQEVVWTDGNRYIANGTIASGITPATTGTTGSTWRLAISDSSGKLPAINGSNITGLTAPPSPFIPPTTGFSSSIPNAAVYNNSTGWLFTLQNGVATPITITAYAMPGFPDAPFTGLPVGVTQTITTPFAFNPATGLWTGVVSLLSATTFTQTVVSCGSNSYGTFGGKSNATQAVGVTLISANGASALANGAYIMAQFVDPVTAYSHFLVWNSINANITGWGITMPAYSMWMITTNKNNAFTSNISTQLVSSNIKGFYASPARFIDADTVVFMASQNTLGQTLTVGTTTILPYNTSYYDNIFIKYSKTTNTAVGFNRYTAITSTTSPRNMYFELSPDKSKIYVFTDSGTSAPLPTNYSTGSGGTAIPNLQGGSSYLNSVGYFALSMTDMGYVPFSAWVRDSTSQPIGYSGNHQMPVWDKDSTYIMALDLTPWYHGGLNPVMRQWNGTTWVQKRQVSLGAGTVGGQNILALTIPISSTTIPTYIWVTGTNVGTYNTNIKLYDCRQSSNGTWLFIGEAACSSSTSATITLYRTGGSLNVPIPAQNTNTLFMVAATIFNSELLLGSYILATTTDTTGKYTFEGTRASHGSVVNSDGSITFVWLSGNQIVFNGTTIRASAGQTLITAARFTTSLTVAGAYVETSVNGTTLIGTGDVQVGATNDNYLQVTSNYGSGVTTNGYPVTKIPMV